MEPTKRTRERALPQPMNPWYTTQSEVRPFTGVFPEDGNLWSSGVLPLPLPGRQKTVDQNNGRWYESLGKSPVGGPFSTVLTQSSFPAPQTIKWYDGTTASNGRYYTITGQFFPRIIDLPLDWLGNGAAIRNGTYLRPLVSSSDLNVAGSKAIAAVQPLNPIGNAAVALGETMKDGIPLPLIQSLEKRADIAKKAGSEYLAAAFGWLPLVSDVKKSAAIAARTAEVYAQLERDSGNNIRRSFFFPEDRVVTPIGSTVGYALLNGQTDFLGLVGKYNPDACEISFRKETSSKMWFKGCFTYYLPSSNGAHRVYNMAKKIHGLELTPDLLWELAPWSWAVDWFSNTGTLIKNVSAFANNGLVMRYGYIMSSVTDELVVSWKPRKNSHPWRPGPATGGELRILTSSKQRSIANPYGFGVSWDSLSKFQTSILVALGITRRN